MVALVSYSIFSQLCNLNKHRSYLVTHSANSHGPRRSKDLKAGQGKISFLTLREEKEFFRLCNGIYKPWNLLRCYTVRQLHAKRCRVLRLQACNQKYHICCQQRSYISSSAISPKKSQLRPSLPPRNLLQRQSAFRIEEFRQCLQSP